MSTDDQQREPNRRDQELSALYQRGRKDEPPPHLDAQILAAAHREAATRPPAPRRARWQIPLALAATVVLSVTVVSLLREQQPEDAMKIALVETAPMESRKPAEPSQNVEPGKAEQAESSSARVTALADASTAPASPPAKRSHGVDATNAAKPVEDARRQRLDPSVSHDAGTEPLPQPAAPDTGIAVAENVVQEKKKSLESEPVLGTVELDATEHRDKMVKSSSQPKTDRDVVRQDTPATAAAHSVPAEPSIAISRLAERTQASGVRTGKAAAPASTATTGQLKPIEPWLKEIAKLRVEGRTQESALQLQILKRSYPAVADEFINQRLTDYEREWRAAATPDAAPSTKKELQ